MSEERLKEMLTSRGVKFFHAINLREFNHYLRRNALISRSEIIENDQEHTRFWSDNGDGELNALSRVFGNLYDFGAIFARAGAAAIPNIYGPISLIFGESVYSTMTDVHVTKNSISMLREKWRESAINSPEEIEKMLAGDKFGGPISPDYTYVEISCSNAELAFEHLASIVVEPIKICGEWLIDIVTQMAEQRGISKIVTQRVYRNAENLKRLQEVCDMFEHFNPTPSRQHGGLKFESAPEWVRTAEPWVEGRLSMWLNYFYNGTVCYLRELQTEPSKQHQVPHRI